VSALLDADVTMVVQLRRHARGGGRMKATDLPEYVEHFRYRVLQDALLEAQARYWHQRAAAFDAARPRAGDFTGQATHEDLEAQRYRLAEAILACRARAELSLGGRIA
jgi:hypothetical protein